MVDDFEKEFGYKRSRNALKTIGRSLGCSFRKRGNYGNYTKEQEDWLRKYSYKLTPERMVAFFNVRFKTNRSYSAIKGKCNELGLTTKKGRHGGATRRPIGTIIYTSQGIVIKVKQPGKWIQLVKYMWELYHKGENLGDRVVVQLDKNPYNFRENNLLAVSKSTLAIANMLYKLTDDAEINRAILLLAEVKAEAHKKAREYAKESNCSS